MRKLSIIALILSISLPAWSSPTKHWNLYKYTNFKGGKSEGVLLPSRGGLRPGLRATKAKSKDKKPGLFYSLLKVGNKVYIGAGDPAAIWTLTGTKLKKLVALKGEVLITKLIKGPGNSILAATLPNGKIYRITPAGKATLEVKLPADHVWDMLLKGNTLYAATGPKAELYKIVLGSKKGKKIWSVKKEKHLLALAFDNKGKILIGTAPEARLYKFNPANKKAQLLHDFYGNEIRDIKVAKNATYVAVNKLSYQSTGRYPTRSAKKSLKKRKSKAILTAAVRKSFARRKVVRGSGTIYQLDSNGISEQMLGLSSGYFTAIQVQGNKLYASDGQSGRIYRMLMDDFSGSIIMQSQERQILDFILEKETSGLVATGDGAAIYSLSRTRGKAVSYVSLALDASRMASFGNLLLKTLSGNVTIETRTGITAKPDDKLWKPWKKVTNFRTLPMGIKEGIIKSAQGRYIQFKVTWPAGSKAEVKSIKLFFSPVNLKPRVSYVSVGSSPRSFGNKPSVDMKLPLKPAVRHGNIKISWNVLNRDGDKLEYKLWIKKAGDKLWRRLSRNLPITRTYYTWKAGFIPDGLYVAKVEASDAGSNPPGKELKSSKVSLPFVVDNKAPVLSALKVRGANKVTFSVSDKFSRIVAAAYKVDEGKWKMILPGDTMFDSLKEKFSFIISGKIKKGAHLLQIRVMDEVSNIGTFTQEFSK
jgi:hypothetical protein